MDIKNRYVLKTFGCKANLFDSQVIEGQLQKQGWEPGSDSETDPVRLCIINSCTVTDEADRQVRKMAARLAKDYPEAAVVVTGCTAEVDPQSVSEWKGVQFVVGNQNKDQFAELVLNKINSDTSLTSDILKHTQAPPPYSAPSATLAEVTALTSPQIQGEILGTVSSYTQILSRHPLDREWPPASEAFLAQNSFQPYVAGQSSRSSRTRAFLKIQEGCDSFCTYCIIPYGRGPSRSVKPGEVIRQIQQLIEEGTREVVLTGTNLGDYGKDWNTQPLLDELIEMILSETKLERLRLSSLDPTEITPRLFALLDSQADAQMKDPALSPRLCPHFHVSLQSPHSRILKLMKRRYAFEEVQECLNRIARTPAPIAGVTEVGGVFVGMDVITGFPGETEEEFEWTYQALESLPWTRLHVFPYSERKGTPATRLPHSVSPHLRKERAKRLNELSLKRQWDHHRRVIAHSQQLSTDLLRQPVVLHNVLLEKAKSGSEDEKEIWYSGYTPNYLRILLRSENLSLRNELVSVEPFELMIDKKSNDVAFISKVIA